MKKLILLIFVVAASLNAQAVQGQIGQVPVVAAADNSPVGGAGNLTTVGSVPYVSASGILNQDAGQFFWDATNNRLGIGTATPSSSLTVGANNFTVDTFGRVTIAGYSAASQWAIGGDPTALLGDVTIMRQGRDTDTGSNYIQSFGANTANGRKLYLGGYSASFNPANGVVLTVDPANSRVGIGTTTPIVSLDIAGSARFYDPTALTGVTQVSIRNGAGSTSSSRPFRFQDNVGTTDLLWLDGSNTAPSIHGNLWYTLAEADPSFRLWSAGSLAWSSTVSSDSGTYDTFLNRNAAGVVCFGTTTTGCLGAAKAGTYQTAANCSSSAGPAVCAAAAAGSVAVAAAASTVVVNSTAVTANSQIFVVYDSSLGTKLGVTCNTTIPALYGVTARTAATSFTLTATAPVTNPACFSYFIIN